MAIARDYGLMLLLCTIWGMAFIAISVGDQQLIAVTGIDFL